MKRISRYLALTLIGISASAFGDFLEHQKLFWIERSKNENIIQYDARILPNGRLSPRNTVVAYWVRLAEQGQIEELTWMQETFAFGFEEQYDPDTDSATLEMAVDFGRELTVLRDGDRYRVKTTINGTPAYLEKVFIEAHKRAFLITVEYIDVYGADAASGEPLQERFTP